MEYKGTGIYYNSHLSFNLFEYIELGCHYKSQIHSREIKTQDSQMGPQNKMK